MAIRTGARAKVEEDIAALAKEVRELRRTRGAGLPDIDTVGDFVVAVLGYDRAREVFDDPRFRGWESVAEAISELQVAPAAQELRTVAVAVFEGAVQGDLPAFVQTSQSLREALLALLEARAGKWRQLSPARDFYPASGQSTLDPVEHVHRMVPKLNRWEVLVWAGKALACAIEDVWLWQLWQTGWREYQEDMHRRGQSSEPMRQSEIAEHMLPEAEALIVDSWPVPPDDQWPDRNTMELTLPRLRKWQAQQRAAGAVPEQTTNDQEQQR